jgi:hypothetical protein
MKKKIQKMRYDLFDDEVIRYTEISSQWVKALPSGAQGFVRNEVRCVLTGDDRAYNALRSLCPLTINH